MDKKEKEEIRVEKPMVSGILCLVFGFLATVLIAWGVASYMHKKGLPRDPFKKPVTTDISIGKPGRGD